MKGTPKALILFCLLLASLICPATSEASSASALMPMEAAQYTFDTPEGLAYTYQQPDGSFLLNIDVRNTRWDDVMLSNASVSVLGMSFVLSAPSGARYFLMETGNAFENDDEVLEGWRRMEEHDLPELQGSSPDLWFLSDVRGGAQARFDVRFAAYIPEFYSVSMDEQYEKEMCYIRWYDERGNIIDTRKLVCERACTINGLYQVNPPAAFGKERLAGDIVGGSGLTWQANDGELIYTPVSPSGSVTLGVEAPAAATGWAPADGAGYISPLTTVNGKRYADYTLYTPTDGRPISSTVGIIFTDASNRVIDKGLVQVYVQKAEALDHSAAYAGQLGYSWQKVPDADLLITNPAQSAGYLITYHDGLLETDMTGAGDEIADADASQIEIKVKAPEGMKSCRTKTVGSSYFYGAMDGDFYRDMETAYDPATEPIVDNAVSVWSAEAFRRFTVPDRSVTVFMPQTFMEDYMYAETTMILWYASDSPAEDAAPSLVQYYNRVDKRFSVTQATDVLASEDEITARLTQPVAVDSQGRPWRLQTRYYLQSGTNARHYELKLLDADGNVVTLPRDETVTVYLPYMDGMGAYDSVQYTLDHYTMNLYGGDEPSLPVESGIRVERMPYGLKFTTNGFSPFVLNLRGAPVPVPTVKPPKTGDAAEPVLWVCALALGLLGMVCGLKRGRRSEG